jgi:hypothetical protein
MPDSVAAASPTTVLPFSLSVSFSRAQYYEVDENRYRNAEVQVKQWSTTSRKSWQITKRLTPTEWQDLLDFYNARKGPKEEFYFYDVNETSPKFSYDETGVAATGRYIVRFLSGVNYALDISRTQMQFGLIEVD